MTERDVSGVIEVFEAAHAAWVLIGAHAVGVLTEPRATADFDFIVEERKLKAVLEGLRQRFGNLDEDELGAAVRLRALDVDLIRSGNHPLFKEALEATRTLGAWKLPRTEVLLVLKFLSAVNPWRNIDRRAQDIVDFRTVYRAVGREALDMPLVLRLAAKVYPGAETACASLIDKIDRGEPVEI